jgi:hypothetical protein
VQNMPTQQVPWGRPNPTDDGPPLMLEGALDASPIHAAYLRTEIDQHHPTVRFILVHLNTAGEWWIYEQTVMGPSAIGGNGWPMQPNDLREADAFCAYSLSIPRAALWYPVSGPLDIQLEDGAYYPLHHPTS